MSAPDRVVGVTGATGCLGFAWLRLALARDPELRVIAIARDPSRSARFFNELPSSQCRRIEIVKGDFRDLSFSADALSHLRRINVGWWHFAATTNLSTDAATAAEAREVNDVGTDRLLSTLRKLNTQAPFFHVSTAYVAGLQSGTILERPIESIVAFRNPYERTKAAAENHVWRFLNEGRPGAIFRPGVVIDGNSDRRSVQIPDLFVHAIHAAVRRGDRELVLRLPETAQINLVTSVWVLDLLARLGEQSATTPRIYHLTSASNVLLRHLARATNTVSSRLSVTFRPDTPATGLPDASRFLDRAIESVRSYFSADLTFDRSNVNAILGTNIDLEYHDLPQNVSRCLRSWKQRNPTSVISESGSFGE